MSRLTPARRAADKSIGFGRAKIDCPDLCIHRRSKFIATTEQLDTYCRTMLASLPNWSTLRVTRSSVSKISSSLLVAPQPAKRITSTVRTQNTVTTRSNTLKGCLQNCCTMPLDGRHYICTIPLTRPNARKRIATSAIIVKLMMISKM